MKLQWHSYTQKPYTVPHGDRNITLALPTDSQDQTIAQRLLHFNSGNAAFVLNNNNNNL